MVIDGATVITGSFNFTKSAEDSNAENLLVIRSRMLASRYTDNWKVHDLKDREDEVYRHVYRAYPTIPSPLYASLAVA